MTQYRIKNGQTIEIPTIGKNSQEKEFKVSHKIWEAGDKKRVYIKAYFSDGTSASCGYVDLVSGVEYLSSTPAWIARNISNNIKTN